MASAFASWKAEDSLVHVELVAQVDQPPQACVDWRVETIYYLKEGRAPEDLHQWKFLLIAIDYFSK